MNTHDLVIYGISAAFLGFSYFIWDRFRAKDYSREKQYSIKGPFPLTGIPDLVRQENGGLLTIHDLKTRSRAVWFESDRIQLSLYKLLIERSTGRKVGAVGYIRARVSGKPDQLLSVPLYDEKRLIEIYDRYMSLLDERESPNFAKSEALCRLCGFYKKRCFPSEQHFRAKSSASNSEKVIKINKK